MNHLRVTRNSEGRHCLEVLAKGGGCVVNEQLLKTHCTKELKDGDRFYIVAAHTIYAFEFQHGYRVESDECSAGPELPRLLCLSDSLSVVMVMNNNNDQPVLHCSSFLG